MINTLHQHQHIAIDLDECLLDGPKSFVLMTFVGGNIKFKTFSIITGRPGRMAMETILDINNFMRPTGLDATAFANLIMSPDMDVPGYKVDPDFKGKAAAKIGATMLVDDDDIYRPGCEAHGVAFMHVPYRRVGCYAW